MESRPGASLVVLIPEEAAGQLHEMRLQWDKSVHRWPDHITLFFNFPFATETTLAGLRQSAAQIKPFRVQLRTVFSNKGSKYFGLEVTTGEKTENASLVKLRAAIVKTVPGVPKLV